MGDEEVEEDKSLKAENILKKLQAEAEAKRSGKLDNTPGKQDKTHSHSLSKNDDSRTEQPEGDKEYHKGKYKKTEIHQNIDDADVHKPQHKKKKRKNSDTLVVQDLESEIADIGEHRKKKKKKHKETDHLIDSLDSGNREEGENLDVSQSSDGLSPHKKRKKHKDGETELETLDNDSEEEHI